MTSSCNVTSAWLFILIRVVMISLNSSSVKFLSLSLTYQSRKASILSSTWSAVNLVAWKWQNYRQIRYKKKCKILKFFDSFQLLGWELSKSLCILHFFTSNLPVRSIWLKMCSMVAASQKNQSNCNLIFVNNVYLYENSLVTSFTFWLFWLPSKWIFV